MLRAKENRMGSFVSSVASYSSPGRGTGDGSGARGRGKEGVQGAYEGIGGAVAIPRVRYEHA